jgi:predicted nucleic acid-binding protein
MPPVGRPPAERNVYPFEGMLVPPAEVVLDTSFVVHALVRSQSSHEECKSFLQNMALSGTTIFFNRFLEAELWETAYQITLQELHPGKKRKDVRRDGRTLRRGKALRGQVEVAWEEALSTLDSVRIELWEVEGWIPEMMTYGLSSYDAIHAATAAFTDVSAFVTMDYDFASVPQRKLQLWVPSHRVRPCRDRRRGR